MKCRECGSGIYGGKGDYWHAITDTMRCADGIHIATPHPTNWHNDVFEEMGWLLDANVKEPEIIIEVSHGRSSSGRCNLCGGINGLHGFSFDKEGKY